jgi:hypothetical protein
MGFFCRGAILCARSVFHVLERFRFDRTGKLPEHESWEERARCRQCHPQRAGLDLFGIAATTATANGRGARCRPWRCSARGFRRNLSWALWSFDFPFHLAFSGSLGIVLRAAISRRAVRSFVRACFAGHLCRFSHVKTARACSRGIDFFRSLRWPERPSAANTMVMRARPDAVGKLQGWRPTRS